MKPMIVPSSPEQRRDLRDGGEQIQSLLQQRHFGQPGFLDGFAHALAAFVAVEDRGLDERATGPGVASQMEMASTTLSRLSTLRTPLRNSVELICARWQNSARSMNTTMAMAAAIKISQITGPPLARSVGMKFL
jgi:hypothetical protein